MEYGEGGGVDDMRLSRRCILLVLRYSPMAALGLRNKPSAFDTGMVISRHVDGAGSFLI